MSTMSETEHLIELVKLHPVLFDLANKDYKDVRRKDKIWAEIGAELEQEGE
jgi:hypothetical protein